MNTLRTLSFIFIASFATAALSAQTTNSSLEFKLQLLEDNLTWGVFVKPDNSIAPSTRTSTGSGQVTLVVPVGFAYDNLKNHGGTWIENARVNSPVEAPGKAYVSFGFVTDEPRIKLFSGEETLLFTFTCEAAYTNQIALFDNDNDPFAVPNSYESNPGNDLGVIDYGFSGGLAYYTYSKNYDVDAREVNATNALASKND
jgi:hypothetical protein